jgi:polyisoprenyl-teichoic acid--peptidoglycan teichoic acid transferase
MSRWPLLRLLPLLAAAALLLPPAAVQPALFSLVEVERAKSVDAGDGVIWVLLLGSDARGSQPITSGRTDTIQLLGISPERGAAAAIGIPRDSVVDLPDGRDRINAAMQQGGTDLTVAAVHDLVGIRPDYVMLTGAEGFLAMVSVLGEVEVESPRDFVTEDDGMQVRRGSNSFDAAQALDFARSRRGLPGEDFARVANQQELLLGLLRGVRAAEDDQGFMERVTLAALGGIVTGADPTDLYRLAQAVTQVRPDRVSGCVVPGTPDFLGEASVVIPDADAARRLGADAVDDAALEPDCRG